MRRLRSSVLAFAACGAPQQANPAGPACQEAHFVAAAEDVARLAACARAGSLTLRPAGRLELAPLAKLESVESLLVGPSVGFEELALPGLREVRGKLRFVGNGNLRGIYLPGLERVGEIEIEGNGAIVNASMPKLVATRRLIVDGNPELELIDIGALAKLDDELVITHNAKLVMIDAPPLVAGRVQIENNATLPTEVVERVRGN